MENVFWILSKIDSRNLVDIVLVAAIIYGALLMVRGTQAVQLLRGVILLALVVSLVGSIARLTAFNWLLKSAGQALLVVVAIALQPELRRALDRLGRAGLPWLTGREGDIERVIREIASGCRRLSERRHGALIVVERETGLQDHANTGVRIESLVVADLLQTIFYPNTALHDGAVIVRGDRILAAACVLPLAETSPLALQHLGTRHRAAVGITEQTDAIAIVVSEESGIISLARNGQIVRHLDERRLAMLLQTYLGRGPRRGRRSAERMDRADEAAGGSE